MIGEIEKRLTWKKGHIEIIAHLFSSRLARIKLEDSEQLCDEKGLAYLAMTFLPPF